MCIGFATSVQAIAPAGSKLGITVKVTHAGDATGIEQESIGLPHLQNTINLPHESDTRV